MKSKSFKKLVVIFAGLLIIAACTKEDTSMEPSSDNTEQVISMKDNKIYLNGNPSDKMISGNEIITIVDYQNKVTQQFTDDEAFKKWSESEINLKSTNGVNLYDINRNLDEIADIAEELGITETYQYGDKIPDEIREKLKEIGYDIETDEKSAITWTTLYDNTNYQDQLCLLNTLFVPALAPDHRNKTESLKLIGINGTWYCDNTWFRGEKIYFITLTHYYLPDLEFFNNRIESIFSIM